jgi:hypothetical protein
LVWESIMALVLRACSVTDFRKRHPGRWSDHHRSQRPKNFSNANTIL